MEHGDWDGEDPDKLDGIQAHAIMQIELKPDISETRVSLPNATFLQRREVVNLIIGVRSQ